MSLILSGTDGLSDVDGTAATPAIRGTDANTGIFFGTDIIGFSEGGVEAARINADSQFVAAAGTAALPVITTTGDTNTGIFFPAADTIAFSEGGAEAMRIDSSGNVGIGTTSPNLGGLTRALTLNTPTGGNYSGVELAGAGTLSARFITNNVGTYIGSQLSMPLIFETNATERMRIDSAGKVGIGTTSPTYPLQIQAITGGAAIRITGRASPADGYSDISLQNNAGTVVNGFFNASNAGVFFGSGTTIPLQFYINGAEVGRFDSSGNLLVGTTSATGKVSIKGSGASTGINFYVGNSNGNDVVFTRDNGEFNTGALASAPYNNNVGAVRTLMVTSAGVLGYNASTRNTKTNITPLTSVNWLFNLQPVSFNYREKDEEGNYTDVAKADVHYGLIAEDTEKVNKELCFYNADGSLAGVNYDMLAPALLKAIQEMKALVDTQASTIQSLTTRITALETP
jgi:hypothetical protein